MQTHTIIGLGGGGGILLQMLAKLFGADPNKQICLVDGDTVEQGNLDRQFFTNMDIGRNKAMAFADSYPQVIAYPAYFHSYFFEPPEEDPLDADDLLWCCADNHTCRREVLQACDSYGCQAVILGNEKIDWEAYWYDGPHWKDTPNDPRVFYPAIQTDHAGDPRAPEGCTGAAQEKTPQLLIANDGAMTAALWLYWFYTQERKKLDRADQPFWPVLHRGNPFRFSTVRFGDRQPKEAS